MDSLMENICIVSSKYDHIRLLSTEEEWNWEIEFEQRVRIYGH